MEEAHLMGNFVRLADMILVEALSSHVIGTVEQLLGFLKAPILALADNSTVSARGLQ